MNSNKILVAVSAGADSMALLHLLSLEKRDILVAHVNYGVRKESYLETEYLINYCEKHQIDLEYVYAPKLEGDNFQALAREFRYQFFMELANKYQIEDIYLAHHLDDHLTTYLMWKHQKKDYYGLKAISLYQGKILHRPLLNYRKNQLKAYCDTNKIKYFDDASNLNYKYLRNKIFLEEIKTLTNKQSWELKKEIDDLNLSLSKYRCLKLNDFTSIESFKLFDQESQYFYLYKLLLKNHIFHPSTKLIDQLKNFIVNNKGSYQVQNLELIVHYGYFYFFKKFSFSYWFNNMNELKSCADFLIQNNLSKLLAKLDDNSFPIEIRNFRDGDKLKFKYGTKKLSRFFIDQKYNYFQRYQSLLVLKDQKIILLVNNQLSISF